MRQITYRQAVPEDAPGIAAVQAYTWLTTYTGLIPREAIDRRVAELPARAERFEASIEQGERLFIALDGPTVVGFAGWTHEARSEAFPEDGEITGLYVFRGYQGMGIGKTLFGMCAEAIKAAGRSDIIVNCLRGNPAAGFYRAMGGEMAGVRTDILRDGTTVEEYVFRFAL